MHDSDAIYSVTGLTTALKGVIETGFPFIWIKGQVANLSRPSSGHIYFSLKDANATLNAVWFKGSQQSNNNFDPLTGEVYEDGPPPSLATSLQNGQEIICAGKLTLYAQRGVYQLVVELAHDAGMGALHIQFEYLCNKLRETGYFDEDRKRPIPLNPAKVAVITAPTGAAIHDFLQTAKNRGFGSTITIYPALMQGDMAPAQIIAQIQAINKEQSADVIVLIRGGGSLEDLQAFNNEDVATATKDSALPIIAGIGHEVDFTLADMTADKRASTPTQVAHLLWSDRQEALQGVQKILQHLYTSEKKHLDGLMNRLITMQKFIAVRSPHYRLHVWQQQFSTLSQRLQRLTENALATYEKTIIAHQQQLALIHYALNKKEHKLLKLTKELEYGKERYFTQTEARLEKALLLLESKNPLQPLERGYALLSTADGTLVNSVKGLMPQEILQVTLADGVITTAVQTITPHPPMQEKK